MTGSDTPPGRATPAGQLAGDPATITVWHNITRDGAGRYTGFHYGFRPGDQMVKVFTCQTGTRGRRPEDIAEDAYAAFNCFPRDDEAAELAHRYAARRLRSLSVGDVVGVGEIALAVDRPVGWKPVRGGLAEVRTDEHGTHPLPAPAPARPADHIAEEGHHDIE